MKQEKTTDERKALNDRLDRYVNGLYTHADAEILQKAWACGEGYEQTSKAMDRVWDDYSDVPTPSQQRQSEDEARQLLKRLRQQEKRVSLRRMWKYAAAVALLILASGMFYYLYSGGSDEEILYTTIQVEHGKQERITLPDGTKVILNAGTAFSCPQSFHGEKRTVKLDGEAFFDVARNRSKPFVVQTGNADIEVLGTSFNVKAYGEDEFIAVTVESGKVKVNMEDAMMQLLPGEQFFLDRTAHEIHRNHENTGKMKSWISGELYFNKTPIRIVINELMRRYDCVIEFEGGKIPGEYLSGAHDNKTLEAVLNSIHYTTGIKYRKEENGKIILYEDK
ncbi:MAG: FecR domain-containing protein [Tannerella sp.]|jgi:ferric-dicitrate binding protein FerR (iron transport regulator)|nr:FecR domain-containing protein [Tannerella sp.]